MRKSQRERSIPLFNIMHSKGPPLPADIWLQLFDNLAEEGDYETIAECAKVCRVLHEWSERYFTGAPHPSRSNWTFHDEEDVSRARTYLATKGRRAWPPLRSAVIVGEQDSKAIPHMATFASTFAAGTWVRIAELRIENAVWPSSLGAADASIIRDLSCLGSIATLVLDNVRFPSIVAFGALVAALPRLKTLRIHNVTFPRSSNLFDPCTFSDFRLLPKPELDTIDLGHVAKKTSEFTADAWSHHVELLAFINAVSSGNAPRVYPWGSVRQLQLSQAVGWNLAPSSLAHLLHALPSLQSLDFSACRSPALEITGTLARPRLRSIVATLDYHSSDTKCMYFARIIHCLIDLDHHFRVTKVSASAELFVSISDTPQILLNKVFKQAGPSLDHVTLHNMGAKANHLSLLRKTLFCHLNLSENNNLKSLELTCSFWTTRCYDYALALLSTVESACMSCIKLDFSPWKGRRLRDVLPKFIAVLSPLPAFNNLKNIEISLSSVAREPQGRMEKRDADLTKELWPSLMRSTRPSIFGITKGQARIGSFWDDVTNNWKHYDIKRDENNNSVVIEVPRFEDIGRPLDFADAHIVIATSAFVDMGDNMGKPQRLDQKFFLLAGNSRESDYYPKYAVPVAPADGLPEITSRLPPDLYRFGFGSLRRFTGFPFTASCVVKASLMPTLMRQRRRQLKCCCRKRRPTFLFLLEVIDDDTK